MSWKYDSEKHSLARRGILTKYRNLSYNDLKKKGIFLNPNKDTDRDGTINKQDCKPLNPEQQGKIHDFFNKIFHRAKQETDDPAKLQVIESAQKELPKVTNIQKLKDWFRRHRHALELAGLTVVIIGLGIAAGGPGQMMMNVHTGEIVQMGGTELGGALNILGAGIGGFAAGEGAREAVLAGEEKTIHEKELKETDPLKKKKLEMEEAVLEKQEGYITRKDESVPIFEEGLEAKGESKLYHPHKFGTVKWQEDMLKTINHKMQTGENFSPQEKSFIGVMKEKGNLKMVVQVSHPDMKKMTKRTFPRKVSHKKKWSDFEGVSYYIGEAINPFDIPKPDDIMKETDRDGKVFK